ncbi:MAG: prepilin-type N-terminal cleavage/methylation domain-containing protein [Fimbriiglobus sp.]
MSASPRKGVTLLELLIVTAILAVMIGLILSAIQKARSAAVRAKSSNNLRQLYIGFQLGAHDYGELAGCSTFLGPIRNRAEEISDIQPSKSMNPLDLAVIMALGGGPDAVNMINPSEGENSHYARIKILVSDADDTLDHDQSNPDHSLKSSYSYNFQVFARKMPSTLRVTDGYSSTIYFSERGYSSNGNGDSPTTMPMGFMQYPPFVSPLNGKTDFSGSRRNTFCDPAWNDVVPVTSGSPAISIASRPALPFQIRPRWEEADRHQLRTFYSGGLMVCMGDGSVRMIGSGVEPTAFWGLITPNGGEVANID